jgi:PKD repeat protein
MKKSYFLITLLILASCIGTVQATTWTNAGGCWTATDGAYSIMKWNATGNFSYTFGSSTTVEYLVIGSGGSGGNWAGGGGGAGAVVNGTGKVLSGTVQGYVGNWTNGSGGSNPGLKGQTSFIADISAEGGGYGGAGAAGGNGGSGGGGSALTGGPYTGTAAGTANNAAYGHQGGAGFTGATAGGGAGGKGQDGAGAIANVGGNGGDGVTINITGENLPYGAGGAGGGNTNGGVGGSSGIGGHGSNGGVGGLTGGQNGTGSGGGGQYANGISGIGGSGVVIIRFLSAPVAAFTPTGTTTGIDLVSVTYTDTSTGTISDYNWSYQGISGGNNTLTVFSTAQNVTASFNVGNFSIKHGINGTAGSNISTQIAWVNVSTYSQIIANFTANTTTPIYPPGAVAFTDLSTPAGLGDTQWLWDFGDSSTSTTQNATHVYTTSGLKTVSLTTSQISNVTNTNTMTKVNYINVTYDPTYVGVDFTCAPLNGLPGLYVTCTDNSIFGNSTTTGRIYNWSFGDGNYASSSPTASHVYPYLGEYTVGLTVNNTANLSLGSGKLIKTNYIVISSNQNTQNTWWTPHTVQLTVMDVYGARLYDVICNATYNQSSMPTQWINEMYGIQSGPQGDMINKTLVLGGTTGGDGTLTFTMLGSLKYDIYLTAPQYGLNNYYIAAFPSDSMLNVYVQTNAQKPPTQTNNTYAQIGNQTKVYFVEPNISYGSMCIDYMDSSGLTSTITETWAFVYPNQTTIQTKTFVPGTTLSTNCYTLPNIRGIQTVWNFNATRVI